MNQPGWAPRVSIMASSSAPRRGRASVAFGSKAEVLPAGSATAHTTPFPADSQHACRLVLLAETAGIGRYPANLESAIYYCCREAIQNASKHGGPSVRISISLHKKRGTIAFEVSDDGPAFDVAKAAPGRGLQHMRDRILLLGGRVSIVSKAGIGTVVSGAITPVSASAAPLEVKGAVEPPSMTAASRPDTRRRLANNWKPSTEAWPETIKVYARAECGDHRGSDSCFRRRYPQTRRGPTCRNRTGVGRTRYWPSCGFISTRF